MAVEILINIDGRSSLELIIPNKTMKGYIRQYRMSGIALARCLSILLSSSGKAISVRSHYLIFLISTIIHGSFCIAQEKVSLVHLDTIYATTSRTTSLIFPARITIYDIGSEDFGGIKEDNLLLLKAAHDSATPTSLIIKYGTDIYHGTLAYSSNPAHLFIDFSKLQTEAIPQLPNETRIAKDDSVKSLDEKISEKRLSIILSDPKSYYKNNAVKDPKERIALTLTDLRTDENNVYLKLLLINESKLDYQIDFVEFVYQNPLDQRDLKGAFDRKNVYQNAYNKIDFVKGKDQRHLGYSIPRYTLGRKGELLVIVREKNGSRSIALSIPFSLILEAKPINK